MKTRAIAATFIVPFLAASLCGCAGMGSRARAEKELGMCEIVPGELSGREDIIRDLRWWQKFFPEEPGSNTSTTITGLWTGRDVFRIAFVGEPEPANTPPEHFTIADEKKLMDSCRRRIIEKFIDFRFGFQKEAGLLTGCVDYPSTAMAWRKEMQGMKLTTDNLRVLKMEMRKDGSFHIILETRYGGIRDYLTKTD